MNSETKHLDAEGVRSLAWFGDSLIDWVAGGRVFHADGEIEPAGVRYAYRFDAAVTSPCGDYAVIYERLGTKGLVLFRGKVLREINRSFYQASAYEYPVAIFKAPSGQILIAHCPEEYNQIELEDIKSGERVGSLKDRKSGDFFHSRLSVSPDGRWLLSAGWIWHPWGSLKVFDIHSALQDASTLDRPIPIPDLDGEVSAAAFLPDGQIVVATSEESLNGDDINDGAIPPNSLVVFDPATASVKTCVPVSEPVGTLMTVDDDLVVGFFGHPKLFSLRTGEVLFRWADIISGNQASSILIDESLIPPIALDMLNKRFAVANEQKILVVEIAT